MNINRTNFRNFSILLLLVFLIGCGQSKKTIKEDTIKEPVPVWDEIDSEIISDSLITRSLQADWKKSFSNKRKPIIVIGSISNLSDETADTLLIAKDIERGLLNSGEVSFISSKEMRETIRTDRKKRNDFSSDTEFKKYLKSLKSDFFLEGTFNVIADSSSVPIKKRFSLTVEILNANDGNTVWEGTETVEK